VCVVLQSTLLTHGDGHSGHLVSGVTCIYELLQTARLLSVREGRSPPLEGLPASPNDASRSQATL
jgi:hypothetical protein